jgi:ankyrin repeat protein
MTRPDAALRELIDAIAAGDDKRATGLLATTPSLACASFHEGATRHSEKPLFLASMGRYVWAGDTALHIAAAAYRKEMISTLLAEGANVRARNRLGDEPLHSAAVGTPGSPAWNPSAQTAAIVALIKAGADPNALNKTGVSPLHRAVRTRCAAAVRALLTHGADPALRNKSGSTPLHLARHNTGRGGTGSPAAKAQQQQILGLLSSSLAPVPR